MMKLIYPNRSLRPGLKKSNLNKHSEINSSQHLGKHIRKATCLHPSKLRWNLKMIQKDGFHEFNRNLFQWVHFRFHASFQDPIVEPSACAPVQLRPRYRSPSNSASPSRWKCLAGPAPSVGVGGSLPGCPGQLEDLEASRSENSTPTRNHHLQVMSMYHSIWNPLMEMLWHMMCILLAQ